jgi:hypothetical protein
MIVKKYSISNSVESFTVPKPKVQPFKDQNQVGLMKGPPIFVIR